MATKKGNNIKMTTRKVVDAYRILDKSKMQKLESDEKFPYLKTIRPLREITEKFDADFKDAQKRLKPEGFDVIAEKFNREQELTEEERETFIKYDRELAKVSEGLLDPEVEISIQPLKHETLGRLIDSNDWTTGQILAVMDVIAEL